VELEDALGKNIFSFQHNALYFTFIALLISEIWRLKKCDNLKRPCVSMLILRFSWFGLQDHCLLRCDWYKFYRYSGGIHCLYLQGRRGSQATNHWGASTFLQNTSNLLPDHKVSCLRWQYSSCISTFTYPEFIVWNWSWQVLEMKHYYTLPWFAKVILVYRNKTFFQTNNHFT
jgi:hypothetical protein